MTTASAPSKEPVRETRGLDPVSRYYRPELDALRFFAFLGVFFFHTFPPNGQYYSERHLPFAAIIASASRAGSFGVDLFFVLSAFLITELLLREKQQFASIHLKAFYLRRILRIWPLYFFAIAVGVSLTFVDSSQRFSLSYVAGFLLLAGNWMTSLFGSPGSVMLPLWSVSFEEQFYLLWPGALSRLNRTLLLWVAGAMFCAAAVGRLILLRYARHSELTLFTNSIARLDPLAFGVITAIVLHGRTPILNTLNRLGLLFAGICVWLLAGREFAITTSFALLGYPAMALGAWLILISVLGIGKAPRVLRYLGKISYGLYVFHMLALYLAEKMVGGYAKSVPRFIEFLFIGFFLTTVFAIISYHFLESPFLRLKERFEFIKSRPV